MNLFAWLKSLFSKSNRALFLYKRAMTKATNGEHEAAIQDYSSALRIASIKPEIKAMTHFNRALAYVASKEKAKAVQDLIAVLDMDADLPNVKKMAKQKLVRIDRRASESKS